MTDGQERPAASLAVFSEWRSRMNVDILLGKALGRGGLETVVASLASELGRAGHQTRLLLMEPPEHEDWLHSFSSVFYYGSPDRSGAEGSVSGDKVFAYAGNYAKRMNETEAPDLILAAHVPLMSFLARLAVEQIRQKRPPVFSWLHGPPRVLGGGYAYSLLEHADAHLAISTAIGKELEEQGLQNVYYLGNPLPSQEIGMIARPSPSSGLKLVYAGRLEPEKRIDLMFHALQRVDTPWSLELIGDGSLRRELKALSVRLGMQDRIVWTGWREDPWKELQEASLLLLTSAYEGFGMVALEALARGIPALSSACGGPEDLIRSGENGWLFDTGSLFELSSLLRRIGNGQLPLPSPQACRESVRFFEPARIMRRLTEAAEKNRILAAEKRAEAASSSKPDKGKAPVIWYSDAFFRPASSHPAMQAAECLAADGHPVVWVNGAERQLSFVFDGPDMEQAISRYVDQKLAENQPVLTLNRITRFETRDKRDEQAERTFMEALVSRYAPLEPIVVASALYSDWAQIKEGGGRFKLYADGFSLSEHSSQGQNLLPSLDDLRHADGVVCRTRRQYLRSMRLNARALYLPQQERLTLPAEKQPSLQPSSGGRPVIGYCGPLSDETDIPLILKLARSRPNWTFLLGGAITVDAAVLEQQSNIRLQRSALPSFLSRLDAAILPLKPNQCRTADWNVEIGMPYLDAGLPLVSIYLPSLAGHPGCRFASGPEEFIFQLEESLKMGRRLLPDESAEKGASAVQHLLDLILAAPQHDHTQREQRMAWIRKIQAEPHPQARLLEAYVLGFTGEERSSLALARQFNEDVWQSDPELLLELASELGDLRLAKEAIGRIKGVKLALDAQARSHQSQRMLDLFLCRMARRKLDYVSAADGYAGAEGLEEFAAFYFELGEKGQAWEYYKLAFEQFGFMATNEAYENALVLAAKKNQGLFERQLRESYQEHILEQLNKLSTKDEVKEALRFGEEIVSVMQGRWREAYLDLMKAIRARTSFCSWR